MNHGLPDYHEETGEFWLVLDDNIATITYGHQLSDRVILRVAGTTNTAECMLVIPDAFIVSDGEKYKLVDFKKTTRIFEG